MNPNRCSYIWIHTKIYARWHTSANESESAITLVYLCKRIYINTNRNICLHTCICTHMLYTHSGYKRVHVDTPSIVTELNWNRGLQSTYVCGLDFIRIDLDHNRVWCVHNWVLTVSTRINPDRGLVCQRTVQYNNQIFPDLKNKVWYFK